MSLPSIFTLCIEFIVIAACLALMIMMRGILQENPSARSLKIKKYIGYVMIAICFIAIMDYSFAVYRFYDPASPFEIISADSNHAVRNEIDRCVKIIK